MEINKVIESFIKAKNERKKEDIDRFQKKCQTAISKPSAQLVKGTLVNNKHKGYLTLLSGKRQPETGKVDETDKCFKERLTWRQMRDILSDLNDFEAFVEKIMSRKATDADCRKHYKTKLAAKADMMQYYRYRRMEEDKEGVMKYTQEYEGEGHEELWGHTILHLAVCFHKTETAKTICKDAPSLIHTDIGTWYDDRDTYNGLTPFHLAVAHGDFDLVKCMKEKVGLPPTNTDRIGRRMKGTVFMGQLPFHTAVLCYLNDPNKDDTYREPDNRFVKIIKLLVERNVDLEGQNYRRDTVLHSIMRFVRCFPACEARAVDMTSWLESLMEEKAMKDNKDVIDYKRKLFFTKNENHMTALQLATECGHMSLFVYFIKIKGVYLIAYPHDDLYEVRRFDVTEIDKVALLEAAKKETDKKGHPTKAADAGSKAQIPQGSSNASQKDGEIKEGKNQPKTFNSSVDRNQSVAELLCCQDLQVATKLVSADVFEEMVRRKLKTYMYPFGILCVGHVSLIILLCVYVVARAAASEGIPWPPRGFLEFCNVVTLLSSILYFAQEFPLRFRFGKQPFTRTAVHHNVVYRVLFVLFAVFLFVDWILYRLPDSYFVDYKTFPLILAILAGTWSILFFLRMSKYFSVYIVLLNEALIRAVMPFAGLILMQVLVFSACMHATFLHTEQGRVVISDFSHYGKSLLTMGKLMIGLTELGELLDSREDFIIVLLFAVFLLITFLLMINALIGVMTNRFHDTQTNREMVCRLQKLSIIIFIEGWFFERTKKLGFPRLGVDPEESNGDNADEAIGTNTDEYSTKRFVMSYRKVRSSTADNPANAEHILRKQVKRSEELNDKMDRLLDLQETKSYDGTRALNIYHYSY